MRKFTESGIGLIYQDPEYDKYTFEHDVQIDCENRRHICNAVCYKMSFALSRQDIDEGTVTWNLGHPYMIAKGVDGYCVHLDKTTYRSKIWENRPVPCRGFDCRNDKRIWLDFENKVINPKLPEVFERKDETESELK